MNLLQELPTRFGTLEEMIDGLQHKMKGCIQDQDEFRSLLTTKAEAMELRMAAFDSVLRKLENDLEENFADMATEMEENSASTRKMLSQAVNRIADQFDAVQISLEDAIKAREQDREAIASSQIEHNRTLREEVDKRLEDFCRKTDEMEEQHSTARDTLSKRIDHLETSTKEAEDRQISSEAAIKEALNVWQQGLETQINVISEKYEEYKQYTGRLRKEVYQLREENKALHQGILKAFSQHTNGLQEGVGQLQKDAVALLKTTRSFK